MTKGKIKKSVSRNVQTSRFHQLIVLTELEEEIEWKDEADLKDQSEALTLTVVQDFHNTLEKVLEELKLGSKPAHVEAAKGDGPLVGEDETIQEVFGDILE